MLQPFVFIDSPRVGQPLAALLAHTLLKRGIQVIDLDGQLAAHEVEQHLGHACPGLRSGFRKSGMERLPVSLGRA